jgi:hypothetical protein
VEAKGAMNSKECSFRNHNPMSYKHMTIGDIKAMMAGKKTVMLWDDCANNLYTREEATNVTTIVQCDVLIEDEILNLRGVPNDMLLACFQPGCTVELIKCDLSVGNTPIFDGLAQGLMPSVTKLYLFWGRISMGDVAKVRSSLLGLLRSPHSSITSLSGRFWHTECFDAISTPHSRIREVSDVILKHQSREVNVKLARCLAAHRHRDLLVILLFRFHHYIVRQAGACLL